MPTFPRGRHPARGSPPRRAVVWGEGTGSSVVTTISTSAKTFLGSSVTFGEKTTIIRQRGMLTAILRTTNGAGAGFHCGLGVGVISADALAVGVTAVPGPLTDMGWPWLIHRIFDVNSVTATVADGANAVGCFLRLEIDSKAMRKVGPNEAIVAVLESVESGTEVMDVLFDTRLLLKLT